MHTVGAVYIAKIMNNFRKYINHNNILYLLPVPVPVLYRTYAYCILLYRYDTVGMDTSNHDTMMAYII